MPSTTIPSLSLNTGHDIPQVGFGVFQVPSKETESAVTTALEAGYRHIDTAAAYGNEEGVGAAIAAAGIPREDLFVTTKVWNDSQGRERVRQAFQSSMRKLGLDYLDLYLIHWPAPRQDLYVETWQTIVELHREGLIRSPGVSNFEPEHIDRLARESDVVPAANQIELHPYLQQAELRRLHGERGIATEAWSPLAKGRILGDPALEEIAERRGVDVGGIALAWSRQLGNVVLTKSVTPERIRANLEAALVELSDEEMDAIAKLDGRGRVGPDPSEFD